MDVSIHAAQGKLSPEHLAPEGVLPPYRASPERQPSDDWRGLVPVQPSGVRSVPIWVGESREGLTVGTEGY